MIKQTGKLLILLNLYALVDVAHKIIGELLILLIVYALVDIANKIKDFLRKKIQ